jgi:hypothetical protein
MTVTRPARTCEKGVTDMSIIGYLWPPDTGRPVATGHHKTPDGYVPQGVAGYIVGDCTVLCPACFEAEAEEGTDFGYLPQSGETDYPGTTCYNWGSCHDPAANQGDVILPETLLVYEHDLPHLSDRELVALELDRDVSPETAHYVLRERARIAYERDHMERQATLKGYESYEPEEAEGV